MMGVVFYVNMENPKKSLCNQYYKIEIFKSLCYNNHKLDYNINGV